MGQMDICLFGHYGRLSQSVPLSAGVKLFGQCLSDPGFFLIGLFPRVTPLDFDPFLSVQIVMYLSLLLLTLSRVLTQQISKMPIFYSSSVCRLHINSQTFCHLVMTRNPGAPLVPLTPPCSTFMAIHGHLVNHHISLDSVTISLFAF